MSSYLHRYEHIALHPHRPTRLASASAAPSHRLPAVHAHPLERCVNVMPYVDTLVIGAGQAGLAMSRSLTEAGVDHAVLERGRLAERWRSERWDSLRLLTPNWATRLPGWEYKGPEPQG